MTELDSSLDAIRGMGVFCAYNANVDAILRVDSDLEQLLPPPRGEPPGRLDSPVDLSSAIRRAMERGRGDEIPISTALGDWLEDTLTPEERRIGGQAGIMADFLSVSGASPILFTHLLSATQRQMFQRPEEVFFPVSESGVSFVPLTAVPEAERTKTNWIFEFARDATFFETTAAETTRFIAASRPDEFTLDVGPLEGRASDLGDRIDCTILSGFHSLKHEYDDGTTYRDQLSNAREFVAELVEAAAVQVEYGVTHDAEIRQAITTEILPLVSVVSFDTGELHHLASDLGVDPAGDGIEQHLQTLRAIRAELDVPAVKLHATEYFLAVTADGVDHDAVRQGFEFAAVVAAAKARHGQIRDVATLEDGLDVAPSEEGVEQTALVGDASDAVAVPNRVYTGDVSTVGIGDTVSCASFVVEQARTDE